MSCTVKDGVLLIRTRVRKGRKAREQASQELADFLWQIDKPEE